MVIKLSRQKNKITATMMKQIFSLISLICTLCYATSAHAARPLVTDDARLTNAHSCQLESWMRSYEGGLETWALPACNLGENFEVTFGGGRYHNEDDRYHTEDWIGQIKTLFKPLETNGWGWGLAVGRVWHPDIQSGPNQLGNTYFYVPVSFSMHDDDVIVHLNMGMLRDKQESRVKANMGLGAEFKVAGPFKGIAEVFGDNTQNPFYQLGMRYSLIPEIFQIDGTIGQQVHGNSQSQWLSIGLRWTP